MWLMFFAWIGNAEIGVLGPFATEKACTSTIEFISSIQPVSAVCMKEVKNDKAAKSRPPAVRRRLE
jgi:hypothetical protein